MAYNSATRTFDSLSDLRGQRGTANVKANLLGYTSAGDGGGGEFYWDASSSVADDGGTVFAPSVGSGAGRWIRNYVGDVYPRWFGAKGDGVTDDSAAWDAAIAFASQYGSQINGEFASYKVAAIDLAEKTFIYDTTFVLTAGTYGLKINDIGQAPTIYKRDLTLKNVTFKGSCTYALIVSTITGVVLNKLTFITLTATNDVMYLLNTYDSEIDRLTFIACTTGVGGSCLNMPAGVNGVTIGKIYTSAFTDYAVRITGGAAMIIESAVIQGSTTGIYMSGCSAITINNPYFENTVNPVEISNSGSDVGGIQFVGGFWAGPYPSHPQIGLNNGVYVRYVGGTNNVTIIGGHFDVSGSSVKKLASVGSSAVINVLRPKLASGGNTPEITDYLFKEPGSLSTAGFYVEYTRTANSYTRVTRTADIANEHVVEYSDAGTNLLHATWNPPTVGSAAVALTFYNNRIGTIRVASYSLTIADDTVRFDTSSGNLIATLPATGVPAGKVFVIKRIAGAFGLSVVVSGGVLTIDGTASYSISGIGDTAYFQFDGTNYIIISRSISAASGAAYIENITSTDSATITNATLNAAYPVGTYPPGSKVAYSNLSDSPSNIAECTRLNASSWYINITSYKAS